ncbi:MAG: cytochrome b [Paracoccaceae bacterium]
MPIPSPKGYSLTQIALHWLVAGLIALQFLLNEPMSDAWDVVEDGGSVGFDPLVAAHVFGGIAILALVLWRIGLRLTRGVPDLPLTDPAHMRLAAHLGHMGLYALMVAIPVSGAVAWFVGIETAAEVHEVMTTLLLVLVAVHAAAAVWHQFWLKDGLLLRMKRPSD